MPLPLNTIVLSESRRYAVGMDLGGTNLKYGIISDRGEVVYSNLRPARTEDGGEAVLKIMKDCAHECVLFAAKESLRLEGIGVGCPGTIDTVAGKSLGPTPHIPNWENAEIGKTLMEAISLPVFADNDGNFMAYGEYAWGAARGAPCAIGITIGTGIGGGIVLGGGIYRGAIYNAAELGHVVVEADGRPCACGNRGCVERYAGGKYMVEDVIRAIEQGGKSLITGLVRSLDEITPRTIFDAAKQGDTLANRFTDDMIKYLGAGLSSIVNVLNPDVIAIGGGVAEAGTWLIDRLREALMSRVMKPVRRQLRIEPAVLGNRAGLVGAASWVLRKTNGEARD